MTALKPVVEPDLTYVNVIGSDGRVVEVNRDHASMSLFFRKTLHDYNGTPIKLPHNITSETCLRVMEFCRFHKTSDGLSEKELKQWNQEFVKVDPRTLCELASAAYYLDIKALVDLTCKSIAHLISGKSAEDIRKTFNIKNDFEGDEESQLPLYYATRGRARNKLVYIKRKPKTQKQQSSVEDERSVDDLLQFIEGDNKSTAKTRKSKSKKQQSSPQQFQGKEQSRPSESSNPLLTFLAGAGSNVSRSDIVNQLRSLDVDDTAGDDFPEFWEDEDDDLPPEMKAELDKEVEAFRERLSQAHDRHPISSC